MTGTAQEKYEIYRCLALITVAAKLHSPNSSHVAFRLGRTQAVGQLGGNKHLRHERNGRHIGFRLGAPSLVLLWICTAAARQEDVLETPHTFRQVLEVTVRARQKAFDSLLGQSRGGGDVLDDSVWRRGRSGEVENQKDLQLATHPARIPREAATWRTQRAPSCDHLGSADPDPPRWPRDCSRCAAASLRHG